MAAKKWAFRMEGGKGVLTTPQGERDIATQLEGSLLLHQFDIVTCADSEMEEWTKASDDLFASPLPQA